jgi:hypothetical protein
MRIYIGKHAFDGEPHRAFGTRRLGAPDPKSREPCDRISISAKSEVVHSE